MKCKDKTDKIDECKDTYEYYSKMEQIERYSDLCAKNTTWFNACCESCTRGIK